MNLFRTALLGILILLSMAVKAEPMDASECQKFKTDNDSIFSISGATYGEAAFCLMNLVFDQLNSDLARVGETIDPYQAKSVRKDILVVREMFDIFVYAFPIENGEDTFLVLREDLDSGYELVGALKDLFDVQNVDGPELAKYDPEELEKKRTPVVNWMRQFAENGGQYKVYLSKVITSGFSERSKKDLSFQFWGSSERRAHAQQSMMRVLEGLIADLFEGAMNEYKTVRKIDHPAKDHERIEIYHDFRKRVRAALKVVNYFVEIPGQFQPQDLQLLALLVEKYGKVSDMVAAHDLLVDRGEDGRAKKIRDDVKSEWKKIQEWEKEEKIKEVLQRVYLVAHDGFLPLSSDTSACQRLLAE